MPVTADFYLIHLTVSVPGFTMRWTAPPPDDGHPRGSDLRLVENSAAILTSSATTQDISWKHADRP
jgi:hypothetical protein